MKDLMADQDEYAALGWDWPKKKSVIEDFIKIIKASQIIGFGVAVDAVAWRQFPKELTRVEGTAQEFCFMRIMRMIVERFKIARPADWAVLYYDCDEQFTPARFQRFIGLRKRDPEVKQYFHGFNIAEPKSFLPLQAADLLAWQTRKDLMRKLDGHESRPEYKLFFEQTAPFEALDYVSEMWTGPELEEKILKPWQAAQQAGKAWNVNEKKSCPECGHEFQGNGWDGIDAHWRSQHAQIMSYEDAWPLIQSGQYNKAMSNANADTVQRVRLAVKKKTGKDVSEQDAGQIIVEYYHPSEPPPPLNIADDEIDAIADTLTGKD
jgi:hypothetical protein